MQITRPAMAKDGYTMQDEPTLSRGSFSGRKKDSADFHVMGAKGLYVELALLTSPESHQELPPQSFERLRELAKKAVARLH